MSFCVKMRQTARLLRRGYKKSGHPNGSLSPTRRHKTVSLAPETLELVESIQQKIRVPMSQAKVIHLALLALAALDDPLDAARVEDENRAKKK